MRTHPPTDPPSPATLDTLSRLLGTGHSRLACYYGHAHIEVAEILHRHLPGRYIIGDNWEKHAGYFLWSQDDEFYRVAFQPSCPECLRVPFAGGEGLPINDLFITDRPWHPGQFERVSNRWTIGPLPRVFCFGGALNIPQTDLYDWDIHDDHIVGLCRQPWSMPDEQIKAHDRRLAHLLNNLTTD